ncbi:MAG: nucleoside 2-deoxyribosyltransferase [bacterium]
MRLGGIMHAVRALYALGIDYDVLFNAPAYLDGSIEMFLKKHNCINRVKIGDVTGAPNIITIDEIKEIGCQHYDLILRDEYKINYLNNFEAYNFTSITDLLLIVGQSNFQHIIPNINKIANCGKKIHIDLSNDVENIEVFKSINFKFDTIFISTSSTFFNKSFVDYNQFVQLFNNLTENLVLKENRGGSRVYDFSTKQEIKIPSQSHTITHSVGVGDVFDIASICCEYLVELKYRFASIVASEYSRTTYIDNFSRAIRTIKNFDEKIINAHVGISLPWEKRSEIHIYLAAPDFSYVDTQIIDFVYNSLKYHNFNPHRPIKENGEINNQSSEIDKLTIFDKDLDLINKCNLLLAVLIFNDPGTLIEIGYAKALNKSVIVYDPNNIAQNNMLKFLPDLVSVDFDEIITKIFELTGEKL